MFAVEPLFLQNFGSAQEFDSLAERAAFSEEDL
jgi:hypothetical protein